MNTIINGVEIKVFKNRERWAVYIGGDPIPKAYMMEDGEDWVFDETHVDENLKGIGMQISEFIKTLPQK